MNYASGTEGKSEFKKGEQSKNSCEHVGSCDILQGKQDCSGKGKEETDTCCKPLRRFIDLTIAKGKNMDQHVS